MKDADLEEARRAARCAHELADALDSYADCLEMPALRGRAGELHGLALRKLREVRTTVESDEWLTRSDESVGAGG